MGLEKSFKKLNAREARAYAAQTSRFVHSLSASWDTCLPSEHQQLSIGFGQFVKQKAAADVVLGQERAHGVSWHRRAEGSSELCRSTVSWSHGQTGILLPVTKLQSCYWHAQRDWHTLKFVLSRLLYFRGT